MDQKKIDRISMLTKISRTRDLTESETKERAQLRAEYIASFKKNLEASLERISIVDKDGNTTDVKRKRIK